MSYCYTVVVSDEIENPGTCTFQDYMGDDIPILSIYPSLDIEEAAQSAHAKQRLIDMKIVEVYVESVIEKLQGVLDEIKGFKL